MAWLLDWIPTLILAVWFGIGVARDSRRFGLGILLVLTVGSAIVPCTTNANSCASIRSDHAW